MFPIPSRFNGLVTLYIEKNYVVFIPDRTIDGTAAGEEKRKRQEAAQSETDDIIAAVSWLRQRSDVDAARVAVSGICGAKMCSRFWKRR